MGCARENFLTEDTTARPGEGDHTVFLPHAHLEGPVFLRLRKRTATTSPLKCWMES